MYIYVRRWSRSFSCYHVVNFELQTGWNNIYVVLTTLSVMYSLNYYLSSSGIAAPVKEAVGRAIKQRRIILSYGSRCVCVCVCMRVRVRSSRITPND